MFDRQIQKNTQKPLKYIAKLFLKFISPNHMTLIGFSFGVFCFTAQRPTAMAANDTADTTVAEI